MGLGKPHAVEALLFGIGDLLQRLVDALRLTLRGPRLRHLDLVEQANSHPTRSAGCRNHSNRKAGCAERNPPLIWPARKGVLTARRIRSLQGQRTCSRQGMLSLPKSFNGAILAPKLPELSELSVVAEGRR